MNKEKLFIELFTKVLNRPKEWRVGQAYFNYAVVVFGDKADELRGTKYDCFFRDDRIPQFLAKLYE